MRLEFLNRERELFRLRRALSRSDGSLVCLYGRRRCGKSRLVMEALKDMTAVYYVGDEREGVLQRRSLARAMAGVIPGFGQVEYPDWEVLLGRWWSQAPPGAVLALDEFPALAAAVPALPGLLQKRIDADSVRGVDLILCGSSQRMMHGLVLDASAPLYGRAREILKVEPLEPRFIMPALGLPNSNRALEAWATWGGVPRYWELAREYRSHWGAVRDLVLDPMGVLHREPRRLLLDDMREMTQASSLLAVIGQGRSRVSEMARRLEKPATSLARPLQRLVELGLVRRVIPFGVSKHKSKQSLYRISDPFLAFWFCYVDPHRSRLAAGQVEAVEQRIRDAFPQHLGSIWEQLARESVSRLTIAGRQWQPAQRWWGAGTDRKPLELDVVAVSDDENALLVGEVKLKLKAGDWKRYREKLVRNIRRFPLAGGRKIVPCLWYASGAPDADEEIAAVSAGEVFGADNN